MPKQHKGNSFKVKPGRQPVQKMTKFGHLFKPKAGGTKPCYIESQAEAKDRRVG